MTSGPFPAPADPGGALPGSGSADFALCAASVTEMKWLALHDAASVVAALAGIAPEPRRVEVGDLPAQIRDSGGWRKTLTEQGIDDLSAVMEPGIAALLGAHARGTAPAAAALALWHEFIRSRAALVALASGSGLEGGHRA